MNTTFSTRFPALLGAGAMALTALGVAAPALAQYRQELRHDPARCAAGAGPSVMVTVNGIKPGGGTLRVQSYRATNADWLESGRWLTRIEQPARAGTMRVCMPLLPAL